MKPELLLVGVGAYLLLRRSVNVVTSLESAHLRWPVRADDGQRAGVITQEYRATTHPGVDIAIPGQYQTAKAVVCAVADGHVVKAWLGPRGWQVLLSHGDWASGYLHLSALAAGIVDGAVIDAGQALGPMGSDPLDAERVVHLHLQLAPGGIPVDPAPYLERAV